MNQYWRLYAKSRGGVALVITLALVELAAVIPVPILVRSLFDQAVHRGSARDVISIVLSLAALRLLATAASLTNRRRCLEITKDAIQRLRRTLYEKLYSLSYGRLKQRDVSELHTLVVEDTERVDVMSNALISLLLPSILAAVGLALVLIVISPMLAAIVAAAAPVVFLVHRVISRKLVARVDQFRKAFESFSRGALFLIRGVELTRAVGAASWELDRQDDTLTKLRHAGARMAWSNAAYASLQTLVGSLSMLAVLGVGAVQVARGSMTVGTLAGFYVAAALFAGVSNTIWNSLPSVIAGNRSLRALISLLDIDEAPGYGGRSEVAFRGGLRLENVSFSYGESQILRGVDLTISPGEVIGLQGPNGAGKTTLVRLILGWERPASGSINADDSSYEQIDLTSFVRQLGVVPQDPFIFSGTVAENIAYGRTSVSDDAIRIAAEDAGALEMISGLPQGFDTVVGENGRLLSGGQRQRIAFARALLGRPPMLILDEPGNHVEHDAVVCLLEGVRRWPAPPSVLFISHASRDAKVVDRHYSLADGVLNASH